MVVNFKSLNSGLHLTIVWQPQIPKKTLIKGMLCIKSHGTGQDLLTDCNKICGVLDKEIGYFRLILSDCHLIQYIVMFMM